MVSFILFTLSFANLLIELCTCGILYWLSNQNTLLILNRSSLEYVITSRLTSWPLSSTSMSSWLFPCETDQKEHSLINWSTYGSNLTPSINLVNLMLPERTSVTEKVFPIKENPPLANQSTTETYKPLLYWPEGTVCRTIFQGKYCTSRHTKRLFGLHS